MKKLSRTEHPVSGLFTQLLFAVFALFLMLMLLFSARVYKNTVENSQSETALGTAAAYITTKFRQHDTPDSIFTGELNGNSALCFRDSLNGQDYITYIYLDNGNLKELFTPENSGANASAGTAIAALKDFRIQDQGDGFYHITLQSTKGTTEEFYLHSSATQKEAS